MGKPSLGDIFTYHAPFGNQPARYNGIRAEGWRLAQQIVDNTPPSREQSLAITAVQEAVMWANAAIAINEKAPLPVLGQPDTNEQAAGQLAAVTQESN